MNKGLFITLEGGEGAGKTEQINFIKKWFEYHNIPYLLTKEPGGTELGEELRPIIKTATYPINTRAELLLFNACRAELVDDVIKPNTQKGITVVSDRFSDSTYAYQCAGRGLNETDVNNIINFATDGLQPDITFWLDITPKQAFARKNGADKGDRIENTDLSMHERVYSAYKHLSETLPRVIRIDATVSIAEVSKQIEGHLNNLYNIKQTPQTNSKIK